MRVRITVVISAILLVVQSASEALAQVTRLFTLSNVQQSIDTSYRLDAEQGPSTSTTQHDLQESYHFGIDYSLYKARLLHGQVSFDLQANQRQFSGTGNQSSDFSSGLGFLYNVNGIFLDRFPYPVSFFASSSITQIPRQFSSSYDQKNDTYGVGVSLSNRFVPVAFNYTHSSAETSGLEQDRTQTADSISFGAAHTYKQLSQTQFAIIDTNQRTGPKNGLGDKDETGNLEVTLSNTLTLGTKELNRMLYSRFRLNDQTGTNVSRVTEFGESLNWDFGRALTSGADYTFSRRETTDQDQYRNNARLWLQHRLFKSVTTRLDLNGTDNELKNGSEQSASGAVSIGYQKLLPGESLINIQGHEQYTYTSNDLDNDHLRVDDEEHPANETPTIILKQRNVVPESIVVRTATHPDPFSSRTDYEVRPFGINQVEIVILAGSVIQPTDKLLVSYQYLVNSKIKYSTRGEGLAADLTLFDNRFRIFAGWDGTRQSLISGRADQVNLTDTDAYRAGIEQRFEGGSATVQYERTTSSTDDSEAVNGFLLYGAAIGDGRYSLSLNDRYIFTQSGALSSAQRHSRSENVLSAGASYNTTLDSGAVVTATANYLNNRGFSNSDYLALGIGVRWNLRRLTISILTQENFRYTSGHLNSDEHLQLRLSRYF